MPIFLARLAPFRVGIAASAFASGERARFTSCLKPTSASRDRRGGLRFPSRAAVGSVIQSGMGALILPGERMRKYGSGPRGYRRRTGTT